MFPHMNVLTRCWLTPLAIAGAVGLGSSVQAVDAVYEQAPINYSDAAPSGPVARLQARLNAGEVRLERRDEQQFLRELLERLDVPVASQVLVFSKTSQQNPRISPHTPRAVYFGDDAYVGWVQGGVVEVADMSPTLGMTFWMLDHRDAGKPLKFERTGAVSTAMPVRVSTTCRACWCVPSIRRTTASRSCPKAVSSRATRARWPSAGAAGT
jgi:hypothetical protein